MRPLSRAALWSAPATIGYLVVAPVLSHLIDQRFGLDLPSRPWLPVPAALLIAAGTIIALWSVGLFATVGDGTPNPLVPPRKLVAAGPYRYSRNPMMLAGWLAGFGLGLALASPSYLIFCATVVPAGAGYVRWIEEPGLLRRFGDSYRTYAHATPRWLPCPARLARR
jgi:protein-S-isoprenylcysteine O-methyltransferase Ste14